MNQIASVPTSETAAREWVRQQVVFWRSHKLSLGPFFGNAEINPFDSADARRFARERLRDVALGDPYNLMIVVDWARAGWGLAQDALADLIRQFENNGTPKPSYLAAYTMDIVTPGRVPRKISGPKKEDDFFRDVIIATLVGRTHEIFRLPIFGRSARRTSCCQLVAEAFSLGEEAVRSIWKEHGRPNALGRASWSGIGKCRSLPDGNV